MSFACMTMFQFFSVPRGNVSFSCLLFAYTCSLADRLEGPAMRSAKNACCTVCCFCFLPKKVLCVSATRVSSSVLPCFRVLPTYVVIKNIDL